MKLLIILLGLAILTGCSTTSTNNANMRGANTNTGYTTNSETNARPTIPPNATNLTPGNLTTGNNSNSNANSNTNRRP